MLKTALGRLRFVALAEGLSYIVLLGIAMPLKYIYGQPEAVRLFGMLHGVLFMALVVVLAHAQMVRKWGSGFSALVFVSSLVPLGAFWMDMKLKRLDSVPAGSDAESV